MLHLHVLLPYPTQIGLTQAQWTAGTRRTVASRVSGRSRMWWSLEDKDDATAEVSNV